eukprot:6650368-Prymnesium_polylepis.1
MSAGTVGRVRTGRVESGVRAVTTLLPALSGALPRVRCSCVRGRASGPLSYDSKSNGCCQAAGVRLPSRVTTSRDPQFSTSGGQGHTRCHRAH